MKPDHTNPVPAGFSLQRRFPPESRVWVTSTGSTNADVLGWAASGSALGNAAARVLVADYQSAGRGRLDRVWEARAGDALLVSFLVEAAEVNGLLPLVLGVAALDVVHQRGGTNAGLKWPNDVMVGSQKLAGILVEVTKGPGGVAAAAGIGMNLAAAPDGAISLASLTGSVDDSIVGVAGVLDDLCGRFDTWLSASRPDFIDAYRERCVTLGQQVRVDRIDGTSFDGRATGIDDDGRLLVDHAGQSVVVQAGDVHHLRPSS